MPKHLRESEYTHQAREGAPREGSRYVAAAKVAKATEKPDGSVVLSAGKDGPSLTIPPPPPANAPANPTPTNFADGYLVTNMDLGVTFQDAKTFERSYQPVKAAAR